MRWEEVRAAHPNQWLVIEAIAAHSHAGRRTVDEIRVVEQCSDGGMALRRYRELRRLRPGCELYFVHTGRSDLAIDERPWIGVRAAVAST